MASPVIECAVCGGTGWRPAGEEDRAMVPCECRERDRAARALEIAGVPPKYRACSFGNFDAYWEGTGTRNDTLWAALKTAERFAGIAPVDDILEFIRADSSRAICQPKGANDW